MTHTLTVKTRHAMSSEIDDQVAERYGVAEIDDHVAVALAAWYQSPGSIGHVLAALASGATVTHDDLADDIYATRREIIRHDEAGRDESLRHIDMLSTWAIDRTAANTRDYVA